MNAFDKDLKDFKDKEILITGGLGFLGSNLAHKLVEQKAQVTLVDCMLDGHGGNLYNINDVENKIKINFCDIRDKHSMNYIVKDKDYIFHLAGQNDHVLALNDPIPDLDINVKGTAIILEACRNNNPDAVIVFSSTRGVYGPVSELPVKEDTSPHPRGIYEMTNYTAEKLMEIYYNTHNIKSINLRLTNIFGPRAQMKHSRFGVVNWFIKLAMENETISLFGGGEVIRDVLYVDDSIEAFLLTALNKNAFGQTLNVASGVPISIKNIAEKIIEIAGSGSLKITKYSAERAKIEPGDFYADISKIRRIAGWIPKTSLEDGIERTINFYKENRGYYWE